LFYWQIGNLLARNAEGAAVTLWHRGVAGGGRKPLALLLIGSHVITRWHSNAGTVISACVARALDIAFVQRLALIVLGPAEWLRPCTQSVARINNVMHQMSSLSLGAKLRFAVLGILVIHASIAITKIQEKPNAQNYSARSIPANHI
jgi:hypothetical protein